MSVIKLAIVEDENNLSGILEKILSNRFPEVEIKVFSTANKFIQKMNDSVFHVVILDIQLPDANGIDILKTIKATYPDTEIILMTAYYDRKIAIEGIKCGAYEYFEKPFSEYEIENVVKNVIEKLRLKKEIKYLREINAKRLFSRRD